MPPRKKHKPVFVVGFMASGKTRLARHLSELLGWLYIDTDKEVEKKAGMSVSEVFAKYGEPHFRRMETQAIAAAAKRRNAVVAVGGGAALDPRNVVKMRASGLVIYRQTPFKEIFIRAERKGNAQRPLWKGTTAAERRKRMAKLFRVRLPSYRAAAHVVMRSAAGTPEENAARALGRLTALGWLKP